MATPIIMPRQGQSVESCVITKWNKKKGDRVEIGEILFSYETDKASFDEEAKVSGTLLEIFFEEGEDVPVLNNIGVIGNIGEGTEEFNPKSGKANAAIKITEDINEAELTGTIQNKAGIPEMPEAEGFKKISPRAKNLAEKLNLDYRQAIPSGPEGRIIERDILSLQTSSPAATKSALNEYLNLEADRNLKATGLGGRITTQDFKKDVMTSTEKPVISEAGFEDIKLSNMRKLIAKSMFESLSTTAQLTLNTSFDAGDILTFRKKIKDNMERLGFENITLNDIIIYAVSRTLLSHKVLNAHFLGDKIRYYKNVNIGIAVDTDRGLMVPTIFMANILTLSEISIESKKLSSQCQSGNISPDYLKGASFTITNLGSLGIESFTPVLNPPQTGILGVNNIIQRLKEEDGEQVYYPAMGLSLTFDHRALDGAQAARFLKELRLNLESFSVLNIK